MTKTKERGQPEYGRNFNIGDLVRVDGYGDSIYRVDSYREIHEVNEEEALGYTEYLVVNVDKEEDWDTAYDEDMSLVATADKAKQYLRNKKNRERRSKLQRQKVLTTDDLLSDLHSFIEIRKTLQPGPMYNVMGEMIKTVKVALEKRAGGGCV
jgi:hypothetical protein